MKSEIINHLTWLTNKVSEVNEFKNWQNDFKVKEVEGAFDKFYSSLKANKHIDLENLTVYEAEELRFCKWSDELPTLYLFPLWIVPLIPEGMEVKSISGNTFKYSKDSADNDVRFGCVAYGIEIGDK
ncbi:MAG: hypothetical protein ACRC7N_21340 [Clostridium sp.]